MPPSPKHDPEHDTRFCRRYAQHLLKGLLTFEEYADNLTDTLVREPVELVPRCLDTIPSEALARYADYLRAKLVPVDFMPHPFIFFRDQDTPAERERIKQERRPRYVAMYEGVLARLPRGDGQ